jgi:hypothetical protein
MRFSNTEMVRCISARFFVMASSQSKLLGDIMAQFCHANRIGKSWHCEKSSARHLFPLFRGSFSFPAMVANRFVNPKARPRFWGVGYFEF